MLCTSRVLYRVTLAAPARIPPKTQKRPRSSQSRVTCHTTKHGNMAASTPRVSDTSERSVENEHITVSPATSNVNLKFDSDFRCVFQISSSLRTQFQLHPAFEAVYARESLPEHFHSSRVIPGVRGCGRFDVTCVGALLLLLLLLLYSYITTQIAFLS